MTVGIFTGPGAVPKNFGPAHLYFMPTHRAILQLQALHRRSVGSSRHPPRELRALSRVSRQRARLILQRSTMTLLGNLAVLPLKGQIGLLRGITDFVKTSRSLSGLESIAASTMYSVYLQGKIETAKEAGAIFGEFGALANVGEAIGMGFLFASTSGKFFPVFGENFGDVFSGIMSGRFGTLSHSASPRAVQADDDGDGSDGDDGDGDDGDGNDSDGNDSDGNDSDGNDSDGNGSGGFSDGVLSGWYNSSDSDGNDSDGSSGSSSGYTEGQCIGLFTGGGAIAGALIGGAAGGLSGGPPGALVGAGGGFLAGGTAGGIVGTTVCPFIVPRGGGGDPFLQVLTQGATQVETDTCPTGNGVGLVSIGSGVGVSIIGIPQISDEGTLAASGLLFEPDPTGSGINPGPRATLG